MQLVADTVGNNAGDIVVFFKISMWNILPPKVSFLFISYLCRSFYKSNTLYII